jgi:hypothetical protein
MNAPFSVDPTRGRLYWSHHINAFGPMNRTRSSRRWIWAGRTVPIHLEEGLAQSVERFANSTWLRCFDLFCAMDSVCRLLTAVSSGSCGLEELSGAHPTQCSGIHGKGITNRLCDACGEPRLCTAIAEVSGNIICHSCIQRTSTPKLSTEVRLPHLVLNFVR